MKRIANWICMSALLLLLGACRGDVAQRYYEEGLSLMEEGDAPQALERLRKAADHARTDSLRVAVYSEMGQLLFAEGLQEQALVAFRQAHDADCRLGDTVGLICDLRDIGNVYRTREADDSCRIFFEEALRLTEMSGNREQRLEVGSQLAGYHLWHGHYEEARRLLLPALQEMPDNAGLRFMAADLYRHTGPQDSAHYYCRSLLGEEAVVHRQMGHKWLAELLLRDGRTDEAARHLEQYELLTDTLQQEIDTEALRRTNALYDYTRRARQNAHLQTRLVLAIATVCVLVSLLLAALFWFSRRRMYYRLKVQQLERLLDEYRNRDEQVADRQQQILTQSPICRRIMQLLGDSAPKPLTDEEWHILRDTIGKTHPQFFRRLGEFQRLSPHEIRISLLIKAGIGPADIAKLTAHSKQSVSSTRSRLYEKTFGQKGTPAQWDEFILSL
ncbi:MAG: hypothetical protein IJT19_09350 [Bacteroidaceae bacterium]|nr:hypothetical protein [Bacteroidaceae bacterium]